MDGHKKALELIAENKRTRSPFLDLGNLGLTEEPEGQEAFTKIVVPIQIKTCAWTKLPFGKIQGMPSKPISSFEPRDDGWGEVFAGMEGAVRRVREKK